MHLVIVRGTAIFAKLACRAARALLLFGISVSTVWAQSFPSGTWQGKYHGLDSGTITLSISSVSGIAGTVTGALTSDHYKSTYSIFGGATLGSTGYTFAAIAGDGSAPAWTLTGNIVPGQSIAGDWAVVGPMDGVGTFSAQFVSAASAMTLGGYLSGNWFNPAQGGHGFQLEFTNQPDDTIPIENELVAIWFVYAPDGSGQNWIFAQGPYDALTSTVTVPATIFHGPKFPFPLTNYDPSALQGTLGDWGTVTFTFSDCDNGTATWGSIVSGYGSGTIPIQRLTRIAGTSCP